MRMRDKGGCRRSWCNRSLYCLAERFRDAGVSVTVIAEKFSPNTTSDKAGAFTQPAVGYPKTTEYDARSQQWTLDTFKHFSSLYHTEAAVEIELSLVSGYKFVDCSTEPTPPWKNFNSVSAYPCRGPGIDTNTHIS